MLNDHIIEAQEAIDYAIAHNDCIIYKSNYFKYDDGYCTVELNAHGKSKFIIYVVDHYVGDSAIVVTTEEENILYACCCDMDYLDFHDVILGEDKEDMTKNEKFMKWLHL